MAKAKIKKNTVTEPVAEESVVTEQEAPVAPERYGVAYEDYLIKQFEILKEKFYNECNQHDLDVKEREARLMQCDRALGTYESFVKRLKTYMEIKPGGVIELKCRVLAKEDKIFFENLFNIIK